MFLKIGTKSIGAIVKTGTLANMGAIANISALAKIGAMLKIGASGSAFHLSIPGVEMTPHVIWLLILSLAVHYGKGRQPYAGQGARCRRPRFS